VPFRMPGRVVQQRVPTPYGWALRPVQVCNRTRLLATRRDDAGGSGVVASGPSAFGEGGGMLLAVFLGVVVGLGAAFVWALWEIEQVSKAHRDGDRIG
jgi:hypothetical protein